MANNDISDIQFWVDNLSATPARLPLRGEKRVIPVPIDPDVIDTAFNAAYANSGLKTPVGKGFAPTGRTQTVEEADFLVKAALSPYVDYVTIRILNRGTDANGRQNTDSLVFRFLINPSQVSVSRTTLDAQAMTRAGWQIGVWGEDMVQISINGKTAGQYFAFGLTDAYSYLTKSYRNFVQLQTVFENNGYWFEGEQVAEGPLAADFTRRRIKMHQDVELTVGNFVWYGMFENMSTQFNADAPWLAEFRLTFIAWKERFRQGSPYPQIIRNDIQRGHSYRAFQAASNDLVQRRQDLFLPPPEVPVTATTPVLAAAQNEVNLPTTEPTLLDYSPHIPIVEADSQPYKDGWLGKM